LDWEPLLTSTEFRKRGITSFQASVEDGMIRKILFTLLLSTLVHPAFSQEQLAIKTRFELTKSGSFAGPIIEKADPTVIGVAVEAGCAASAWLGHL
jgi:hypothetical protein